MKSHENLQEIQPSPTQTSPLKIASLLHLVNGWPTHPTPPHPHRGGPARHRRLVALAEVDLLRLHQHHGADIELRGASAACGGAKPRTRLWDVFPS